MGWRYRGKYRGKYVLNYWNEHRSPNRPQYVTRLDDWFFDRHPKRIRLSVLSSQLFLVYKTQTSFKHISTNLKIVYLHTSTLSLPITLKQGRARVFADQWDIAIWRGHDHCTDPPSLKRGTKWPHMAPNSQGPTEWYLVIIRCNEHK